jgi:hypothetical protein
MKKKLLSLAAIFVVTFIISCGNSNNVAEKKSSDSSNVSSKNDTNSNLTDTKKVEETKVLKTTAKFISVKMEDIVASLIFQKEDGSKIIFFRNIMEPQEPALECDPIDGSGSINKALVGKTFLITYKVDPERTKNDKGEPVAANLILTMKAK